MVMTDQVNPQMQPFRPGVPLMMPGHRTKESLEYNNFAHNFGDVPPREFRFWYRNPAFAARVKHILGIKNPETVAYDMLFGCPGWVESMIQPIIIWNREMQNALLSLVPIRFLVFRTRTTATAWYTATRRRHHSRSRRKRKTNRNNFACHTLRHIERSILLMDGKIVRKRL